MESVLRYLNWASAGLALLAGLLSLLLLEIFRLNSSRSRSPPGPRPLPFIGNLFQIIKDPMALISSMQKYGELSSVYLGRTQVIVLNNVQMMKEAFVQNGAALSGRPHIPLIDWITSGYGIILANGHSWKQQRRFAQHSLRYIGLGKKSVEERVAEEAQHLIREMLKQEGSAYCTIHPIMNAVSNIICSIIYGVRFEYDDKHFTKLLEIVNKNYLRLAGSPMEQIFNLVPIIKHFPGPHQKVWQESNSLIGFIKEIVEDHRKTLDPENLQDFIDAYLVEMAKQESKEDSTFHEENMIMSVADLFLAGTDTTATTLRWGLIYMMDHPDIQERCHEEIVRVLGFDRSPCMDDRAQLPYTYATVHEIQRWADIVPLGVIHQTTQPAQLGGFQLPTGTLVAANLKAIMSDREHWKHPVTFNPENFLDEKGQFCRNDSFLPFSLGPRVCLGETLARTELFIFFTSLLQRLQFSWPPGAPPPNMDAFVGALRRPPPFHTVCRSRETPL